MVFALPVTAAEVVCQHPTIAPASREPLVTRGPTEIVVGIYWQGGAYVPHCRQEPHGPDAGTVTVWAGGKKVASETLKRDGVLFRLHVKPGTYRISGSDSGFTANSAPSGPLTARVTVTAGHTVRQDLFVDVP